MAASEGKPQRLGSQRLGVTAPPKKSTLAYANEHRPWQVYQALFECLFARLSAGVQHKTGRRLQFKNKLLSLDATRIPVSLSAFDWAKYRRGKGAVKLHLVLDHDGYLPRFAAMTEGRTHEIQVARQFEFEPGMLLVMDRGYADAEWFLRLTEKGVFFVTRLKDSAEYGIVEERKVPEPRAREGILRDEVILLAKTQEAGPQARLRRIEVWSEERQETIVFLTNHLTLARNRRGGVQGPLADRAVFQGPETVAAAEDICGHEPQRGVDPNLDSTHDRSLSNLVPLLRQQLFVHRDLMPCLSEAFAPPGTLEESLQMALPLARSCTSGLEGGGMVWMMGGSERSRRAESTPVCR